MHISSGIGPVKLLLFNSKPFSCVSRPNLGEIVPLKLVHHLMLSVSRFVQLYNSSGIDPDNPEQVMPRYFRLTRFPISLGSAPVTLSPYNHNSVKLDKFPISAGIFPSGRYICKF